MCELHHFVTFLIKIFSPGKTELELFHKKRKFYPNRYELTNSRL